MPRRIVEAAFFISGTSYNYIPGPNGQKAPRQVLISAATIRLGNDSELTGGLLLAPEVGR